MEAVGMDMEAMEEDMVTMVEVMVTEVEAMGYITVDTKNMIDVKCPDL